MVGYYLGEQLGTTDKFDWLNGLSMPVQVLAYLLIVDFVDYWMHRTSHRVSWWWEGHKLHHSATNFNLLTSIRHHPIDNALGMAFTAVPMAMIGISPEDYLIVRLLQALMNYLQHSMLPWRFGFLGRYLLMSPIDHRIHHSPYPVHWDKNFGHYLIIWDRLFGTYYAGDFVNERVGLSDTGDNRKGFLYDLYQGQVAFLRALTRRKWSFRTGVLSPTQLRDLEVGGSTGSQAPIPKS